MKVIALTFLTLISGICIAQDEYDKNEYAGALATLLINHSPSAKAEAMGKGLVASNNGDFGSYYNPALTSLKKGLDFNFSYAQVGGEKPNLSYLGASYSNSSFGSIGVSAYYFSKGQKSFYDAVYAVNYSREVFKDFHAGINFGVYHYSNFFGSFFDEGHSVIDDGVTMDLGLLKKFRFKPSAITQAVQIGTALYNITNSKISNTYYGTTYKDPLPVIFRIGASHEVKFADKPDSKRSGFSFLTHLEYEKFLNSKFDAVFKLGEEFTIKEIVHLRAGYYYSEVGDADYYGGYQSEFTAGIGVELPLDKFFLTPKPFTMRFDFTSLGPPKDRKYYNYNYSNNDNYSNNNNITLALSLNYIP